MQCDNPGQIARVCYDVAKGFSPELVIDPPWQNVALLIGTSAVETGFMRGDSGPKRALGLWNITYHDADVTLSELSYNWLSDYITFRSASAPWKLFSKAWLGVEIPFVHFAQRELRRLLVSDDKFSCVMAMWLYLGSIDKLGENLTDVADHWYRYYLSDHNTRKPSEFLDSWTNLNCNSLMMGLGYA